MDDVCTDDTFAGTGIPCSAMAKSFEDGSPTQLFEKALERLDPVVAADIRSIETIEQAEEAYNKTKIREERDAILVKWIILCKTNEELADPMMRSPSQSLPEAAALQKVMQFKLS